MVMSLWPHFFVPLCISHPGEVAFEAWSASGHWSEAGNAPRNKMYGIYPPPAIYLPVVSDPSPNTKGLFTAHELN